MQNQSYLSAYLSSYPSAASMLLGGTSGFHSNSDPLGISSALSNELNNAARNSALLQQLVNQHQVEKQQKALLAQRVAALTGNTVTPPLSENNVLLALIQKKQQQDQQELQQRQLQELQACMGLAPLQDAPPQYSPVQGLGGYSADPTAVEAFALAGLTCHVSPAKHHLKEFQMEDATTSSSPKIILEQAILSLPPDRRRKGRTGKFPQKLHQMFSDLERQGRSDIASFMPHGRAFAIHKPIEFAEEVMPKYFRMSRFSSFQRQLNLYDFLRITEGADKGTYYHELFVQGRPIVCAMMKRNKIKGVKQQQQNHVKGLRTTMTSSGVNGVNNHHNNNHNNSEETSIDDEDDECASTPSS